MQKKKKADCLCFSNFTTDAYKIARYQSSTIRARYDKSTRFLTQFCFNSVMNVPSMQCVTKSVPRLTHQEYCRGLRTKSGIRIDVFERHSHNEVLNAHEVQLPFFFALVCFLVQPKPRSRTLVPHSLAMLKPIMRTTFSR